MSDENERRALIHAVVVARKAEANSRAMLDKMRADWEAANAEFIGVVRKSSEERDGYEAQLRALILAEYEKTGSKKPAPGLGVRVVTKIQYDATSAFTWAMKHGLALKLDIGAFEKLARSTEMPFVTTTQEATATISPDLTEEVPE